MASTRNKNSIYDYKLEQNQNINVVDHRTHSMRNYANIDVMPDAGIYVSHMPMSCLSTNAIDVESSLRGIQSSNLVDLTQRNFAIPQSRTLKPLAYFERLQMMLPDPLVIEDNQRPLRP